LIGNYNAFRILVRIKLLIRIRPVALTFVTLTYIYFVPKQSQVLLMLCYASVHDVAALGLQSCYSNAHLIPTDRGSSGTPLPVCYKPKRLLDPQQQFLGGQDNLFNFNCDATVTVQFKMASKMIAAVLHPY